MPKSGSEIEEYLTKSGELDFNLIKAQFKSEGKLRFRITFCNTKTQFVMDALNNEQREKWYNALTHA
jgi:hypothetical protein